MKNMVTKKLLLGAIVLPMVFSGAAMAAEQPEGYASEASGGTSAKDSSGDCWRTGYWTPAMATYECDPDLMPKPEKKVAAEPAPAPAPAPVPAHQGHCGMRMQVDQAGDQRVMIEDESLTRLEPRLCLVTGNDSLDHALIDCQRVVLQYLTRWLDRNYPARLHQRVNFYRIGHLYGKLSKKKPCARQGLIYLFR